MKAALKLFTLGLLLLAPISSASAQAPLLSPIPNVALNDGTQQNVAVIAVDPANRPITITASLPSFITLNQPTLATGVVVTNLTLAPSGVQPGDYSAAVTATAGGVPSIRVFQITVNAAGANRAPTVTVTPIHEVTSGSTLTFVVTASDADNDAVASLTGSPLPFGSTFTPNASNTSGTFSWTPEAGDAGEYDIVFTASNALSGSAVAHIRVAGPPTLQITAIDDVTVEGGQSASVPVHASFMPGALIDLTAALPSFATLNPPGSGTGSVSTTITVSPPTGSAGTYHASVTAISEGNSVTELFDIIVTGTGGPDNHQPVLSAPATATVAAGSPLSFDVTATDADGDHVDLFGGALPPGSDFVDHGDNSGTFAWTPGAGQAGSYTASFTGLDGRGGSGAASTEITVTGGTPENHAPTLNAPLTLQVNEGENLSFMVIATDQDGDHVTLTANSVPSGATFTDQGDNTGAFSWTPGSTQSGTYVVAFLGNDGRGGTGTASTEITVTDVPAENRPPAVSAPSTEQVDEGVLLSFTVTATDPDGDHVTLSVDSVPSGAVFTDQGNNSGTFSWTPSSTQSGNYQVTFAGDDGHGGTDTATTMITVHDIGGGVAEVPGKACLIGDFKSQGETTCFRIRPVDRSFSLSDVDLTSIRLSFHGQSITALDGAKLDILCRRGDDHDGHDGDDDDQGENEDGDHPGNGDHHGDGDRHGNHHADSDHRGNGYQHDPCDHPGRGNHYGWDKGRGNPHRDCDEDEDVCGVSCRDDRDDDGEDDDRTTNGGTCDTLGIRACFSTDAVLALFGGAALPCSLSNAQVLATLTNGATVVATFNRSHDDGDDDDDKDKTDKDKDKNDKDDDNADDEHVVARNGHGVLNAKVRPNPINPRTDLSFTTTREGTVRVAIYDLQGRLLKVLLNDYRSAGQQQLPWDGSDSRGQRVASGVYYFQIQAPDGQAIQRVTVLK